MKIICVCTHSQGYFPVLQESCANYNFDLTILGWGEEWKGFGWKLKLISEFVSLLPADEVIASIDAFDTIVLQDPTEIERSFRDLGASFLCAAERKHNNPMWNLLFERAFNFGKSYPETGTNFVYLNAGAWITTVGYFRYLADFFAFSALPDQTNDQKLLTELYIHKFVAIDYDCRVFSCIRSASDVHLDSSGQLVNSFSLTRCLIIHAPAGVRIERVLEQVGLSAATYSFIDYCWKLFYSITALFDFSRRRI